MFFPQTDLRNLLALPKPKEVLNTINGAIYNDANNANSITTFKRILNSQ